MARPLRPRVYPDALSAAWHAMQEAREAIDLLMRARARLTVAKALSAAARCDSAIRVAEKAVERAERLYMTYYYEQRRLEGNA